MDVVSPAGEPKPIACVVFVSPLTRIEMFRGDGVDGADGASKRAFVSGARSSGDNETGYGTNHLSGYPRKRSARGIGMPLWKCNPLSSVRCDDGHQMKPTHGMNRYRPECRRVTYPSGISTFRWNANVQLYTVGQ